PVQTEFDQMFLPAFRAVVEEVVESAATWQTAGRDDEQLVRTLDALAEPFSLLWMKANEPVRLSSLEAVGEQDWEALREFIGRYGRDLFHARFMTLANLQAILYRGVGSYLDYLGEQADPLHPVKLLDDLGTHIRREDVERLLRFILQALVENYDE